MKVEKVKTSSVKQNPQNPRVIRDEKFKKLVKSIKEFPEMLEIRPIVVDENGVVLGGNMRLKAAKEAGLTEVPVLYADNLTEEQKKEFVIKDNASFGEWNWNLLEEDWNLDLLTDWGLDVFKTPDVDFSEFPELDFNSDKKDEQDKEKEKEVEFVEKKWGSLAERFIAPPFTILDTNKGYWNGRKAAWKSLGIKSEIGREGNLFGYSQTILNGAENPNLLPPLLATEGSDEKESKDDLVRRYILFTKNGNKSRNQGLGASIPDYYDKKKQGLSDEEIVKEFLQSDKVAGAGTSIFDPVLCEVSYKWFCKEAGHIFDPFAGGSVRGVVAAKLGYKYTGIELREEQVEANRQQAEEIVPENKPTWIVGTSEKALELAPGKYDLVFTCPPYYDLEVYSDDPEDLSTMDYKEFEEAYEKIIEQSVSMLNDNSFSVFVVGDVRDKQGFYLDFIGKTIAAHEKAGCRYYNQAILIGGYATAAMKAARQFNGGRKLTKVHQNVLVFYKGNPKNIKEKFQNIEVELGFEANEEAV
jgi:DNA modification methylase